MLHAYFFNNDNRPNRTIMSNHTKIHKTQDRSSCVLYREK